ncbi:hypothetical protein ABE47_06795 [Bacillus thuringiensis]|uniref:Uncharacterized protein n=1 Tax=Bacillus thuringiensis YBT-1518 TaxID=529122 RepID=A0A9W3KG32_BACTU|nr:hypothetical protein [Bacillus thuringiensis]EKS8365503.1 hypothetical protein [Bacillus cereus]AHA71011.1 hypothetical protein YBT1518_09070 [Bacillus thuringiensis YBT-1518]MBG9482081.1 hypothetical protein [Bacillus thuringiensis]MBG9511893.1 hypothetical protein [Bacillus thuringiensis]PGL19352.1 hypothetical protein CN916_29005 [Bacillus thuringiensis]
MFWLGCFLGYMAGSVITCALLYFGFRADENKKADKQRRMLDESVRKEMEQLKAIKNDGKEI